MQFLESIEKIWHRRHTVTGLFSGYALIISLAGIVVSILSDILREDLAMFSGTNGAAYFYGIIVTLVFLLLVSWTGVWLWGRRVPRLSSNRPGVIFSLHSDSDCSDLIRKTFLGFQREMKKRGLQAELPSLLLAQNREIHNHEEATAVLEKSGATLVVFGYVARGAIDGVQHEGFSRIGFTWRVSGDASRLRKDAFHDALRKLPLNANEQNGFIERPRVEANLQFYVRFFTALSFTLQGKSGNAKKLWHKLSDDLRILARRQPSYSAVSSIVEEWKDWNDFAYVRYVYYKSIKDYLTKPETFNAAQECLEILEKLESRRGSPSIYLQLAVFQFHLGDLRTARKTLDDGLKRYPEIGDHFHVSLAFLAMWRDMPDLALKHYRKVTNLSFESATEIIDFVERLSHLYPEKHGLIFAIGFLRDRFQIEESARQDYELFIEKARARSELSKLVLYANQRLKKFSERKTDSGREVA